MDTGLKEAFEKGNVQLFVGSGLSYGLYPNAGELRDWLLDDPIYIDGEETTLRRSLGADSIPLEDVAEFYELYKSPEELVQVIRKIYDQKKSHIDIHRNIWKLPKIKFIYTTNYDCLIEDSLESPRQSPLIVTRFTDAKGVNQAHRCVLKPHGCARRSRDREEFIIRRNDYLNYTYRRPFEALRTTYDITTKTFLFLGYSLKDLNMRHIITEANRMGCVRSYAVLKDTSGPEARYWNKLNVTLIQREAKPFIEDVFRSFPVYNIEWDEKIGLRVEDKEEIANKAIRVLKSIRERLAGSELIVILDAGSTCLILAKALVREIEQGLLSHGGMSIMTNSPSIMSEIANSMRHTIRRVPLIGIGGRLRYETDAFTSTEGSLRAWTSLLGRMRSIDRKGGRPRLVVAFIGTTSIDRDGLKSRSQEEVCLKKIYIDKSDYVYVFADHSKLRFLSRGEIFSPLLKDKMSIITDRVDELKELDEFVKEII